MQVALSAEEFIDQRFELPEAGQWAELVRGQTLLLQPPDLDHGNVILNLSKALSTYIQNGGPGYACFDLGIQTDSRPDTIRFPAACYFLEGPRFEESDHAYTRKVPSIVIELASTSDRRKAMAERVLDYHEIGVPLVWVIDPKDKVVHICECRRVARMISEAGVLSAESMLPGFSLPVPQLFVIPEWWA